MYYVVNDLHGANSLIDKTVDSINRLNPDDILIINGDGAGARGPRMNNLVKIFYEVRRGETDKLELFKAVQGIVGEEPEIPDDWIYDTVHAGIFRKLMADKYQKFADCLKTELLEVLEETLEPLSEAAQKQGVKLIYLPGNGEITPEDFSTEDFTIEVAVTPEERFYQRLAHNGYFEQYGIEYVPYAAKLEDGTVLLSTNLLDLDEETAVEILDLQGVLNDIPSKIVVHYPPTIAPIGGAFSFWTPNKMDVKRSDALRRILNVIQPSPDTQIYFGHIHLGATDSRMALYPTTMGFKVVNYHCTWVKPGTVLKI